MSINIHEFSERFSETYDFLYDSEDRVAGFDEAVDAFDEYLAKDIQGFKAFVAEFSKYRHDIISSDREAAAFMFVLEEMGALV